MELAQVSSTRQRSTFGATIFSIFSDVQDIGLGSGLAEAFVHAAPVAVVLAICLRFLCPAVRPLGITDCLPGLAFVSVRVEPSKGFWAQKLKIAFRIAIFPSQNLGTSFPAFLKKLGHMPVPEPEPVGEVKVETEKAEAIMVKRVAEYLPSKPVEKTGNPKAGETFLACGMSQWTGNFLTLADNLIKNDKGVTGGAQENLVSECTNTGLISALLLTVIMPMSYDSITDWLEEEYPGSGFAFVDGFIGQHLSSTQVGVCVFSPAAESFGVLAQIGSGVVRGGPEVRFHEGFTRVPRGFHEVLRGLLGGASTKKSTACCWGYHLSLFRGSFFVVLQGSEKDISHFLGCPYFKTHPEVNDAVSALNDFTLIFYVLGTFGFLASTILSVIMLLCAARSQKRQIESQSNRTDRTFRLRRKLFGDHL